MNSAGRICPVRYHYGASALARAPERHADILYVIGGLYGNAQALDTVEIMARSETGPVTLCFNGDFDWFNVDDDGFRLINERVLSHDAILGNVEAELVSESTEAGCGCAYPESVDTGLVERSNLIHARLKQTAASHPEILAALSPLPMFARYQVGDLRVGVVHGDADSLAGWRFDITQLDSDQDDDWRASAFAAAEVDVFASSHTCLPAIRHFGVDGSKLLLRPDEVESCRHTGERRYPVSESNRRLDPGVRRGDEFKYHRAASIVANNGAAGMPNFSGTGFGILTRISLHPSPHQALYGTRSRGVYVDALPIHYDRQASLQSFLTNWPEGSPAWQSYFQRIANGPNYAMARAAALQPDKPEWAHA